MEEDDPGTGPVAHAAEVTEVEGLRTNGRHVALEDGLVDRDGALGFGNPTEMRSVSFGSISSPPRASNAGALNSPDTKREKVKILLKRKSRDEGSRELETALKKQNVVITSVGNAEAAFTTSTTAAAQDMAAVTSTQAVLLHTSEMDMKDSQVATSSETPIPTEGLSGLSTSSPAIGESTLEASKPTMSGLAKSLPSSLTLSSNGGLLVETESSGIDSLLVTPVRIHERSATVEPMQLEREDVDAAVEASKTATDPAICSNVGSEVETRGAGVDEGIITTVEIEELLATVEPLQSETKEGDSAVEANGAVVSEALDLQEPVIGFDAGLKVETLSSGVCEFLLTAMDIAEISAMVEPMQLEAKEVELILAANNNGESGLLNSREPAVVSSVGTKVETISSGADECIMPPATIDERSAMDDQPMQLEVKQVDSRLEASSAVVSELPKAGEPAISSVSSKFEGPSPRVDECMMATVKIEETKQVDSIHEINEAVVGELLEQGEPAVDSSVGLKVETVSSGGDSIISTGETEGRSAVVEGMQLETKEIYSTLKRNNSLASELLRPGEGAVRSSAGSKVETQSSGLHECVITNVKLEESSTSFEPMLLERNELVLGTFNSTGELQQGAEFETMVKVDTLHGADWRSEKDFVEPALEVAAPKAKRTPLSFRPLMCSPL